VSVEGDPASTARANASRRASNKGSLSTGLDDYLRLLAWTGRQVRRDKRGAIPGQTHLRYPFFKGFAHWEAEMWVPSPC